MAALNRGAELRRHKRLTADPEKARAWQQRSRKPLPATGRKAAREADDVAAFRAEVKRRAGGLCQLRRPACSDEPHAGGHAHHIWPSDRDRGVHDPDRGLFTCPVGHDWVHGNPRAAEARGWLGRSGS